jgi:putative ABC transport system substrate-binding protein
MRRLEFIAALMIASAPRHAVAQQPAKTKRIAVVSAAVKVADIRADKITSYRLFFEELNRVGYVEGQNLLVELYSAEGTREHYAELARDVVGTRPNVILVFTSPLALGTIPKATRSAPPDTTIGISVVAVAPSETFGT